jgi:hypothetical protein
VKEEILPGKLFVFPSEVIRAGVNRAKEEIRSKIRLLGGNGKASHFRKGGFSGGAQ